MTPPVGAHEDLELLVPAEAQGVVRLQKIKAVAATVFVKGHSSKSGDLDDVLGLGEACLVDLGLDHDERERALTSSA
jgi:hypothetical protein